MHYYFSPTYHNTSYVQFSDIQWNIIDTKYKQCLLCVDEISVFFYGSIGVGMSFLYQVLTGHVVQVSLLYLVLKEFLDMSNEIHVEN